MDIDKCQCHTRLRDCPSIGLVGYTHVLCCPCCSFSTLSFSTFQRHALTHDASQFSSYKTYTCSQCQSTSTEQTLMLEHVHIYHGHSQRPAEVTEKVHTIIREPVAAPNKLIIRSGAPGKHISTGSAEVGVRASLRSKAQTRAVWASSRLQQKLRIRSRLNKGGFHGSRRSFRELLHEKQRTAQAAQMLGIKMTDTPCFPVPVENEPIDMTIKADFKTIKSLSKEASVDSPELKVAPDFGGGYPNIRSYLYDSLTKAPMPAGLNQSLMLRYLTAQFQSLQAAKYFNATGFLGQPPVLTNPDSVFQQRLYDSQLAMSVAKPQESSISQRNLHRNNFSPFQNHILLEWYDSHKQKPYPSTEETKHLAALCGLSYPQVKKWFANKRARSSFYQKDDILLCQNQARFNLLRFPLQMAGRLGSGVAKSLETQLASIDNLATVSSSSQDDSLVSS